ncbi:MAG: single-stranded DNA-binding protein [Gammaproteobacteria bacterium]|nr:single-stranded DNA-binding protein [Gammaproteobacteria bacterium]
MDLIETARTLRRELRDLRFAAPVDYVYSPLEYAWNNYRIYLERFGAQPRAAVLIGINPGPWGMMQTGIPFGDASMVRDWLGIVGAVEQPRSQHPARPVLGFNCTRGEVSGQRLWGWAQQRYGTADEFFARYFVLNYCPLAFLEASGRNRTPDKLPRAERKPLFDICDCALARTVAWLSPRHVIGIGHFAAERARQVAGDRKVGVIPHPSPANPAANRGWGRAAEQALVTMGVEPAD